MKVQDNVIKTLSVVRGIPVEEITPKSHLRQDLRMDSLDAISLLFDVEKVYGIHIPDETARRMATVQDIIDAVEVELREKTA